jgi:hypothetical protein
MKTLLSGSALGARALLLIALVGASSVQPASAAQPVALPGTTYASLRDLPDWSGWWGLPIPFATELLRNLPPMKPADIEHFRAARALDTDPDPGRFCRPPQFVGFSGGFVGNVEVLFTPGRVTLTDEQGLIRRIYTDGRPLPREVEDTNTGTSVGRWEGSTLVVETIGINPEARYPGAETGAVPIGRNVRITERISLKDKDTLQFEVETSAPELFTAVDRRVRLYSRVAKQAASEISFCVDYDRSIDPDSGKQRFDMTPPADLPPPPPPPQ